MQRLFAMNLGDDNVKYINTNIMEEQPVIDAMTLIKEAFGRLACCN